MCECLEYGIKSFGVCFCRCIAAIIFLIGAGLICAGGLGGFATGDDDTTKIDKNIAMILIGAGSGLGVISCCLIHYCSGFKMNDGTEYKYIRY